MSKKVAVLITDEFEDSEFTSPAATHRIICAATIVSSRLLARGYTFSVPE